MGSTDDSCSVWLGLPTAGNPPVASIPAHIKQIVCLGIKFALLTEVLKFFIFPCMTFFTFRLFGIDFVLTNWNRKICRKLFLSVIIDSAQAIIYRCRF